MRIGLQSGLPTGAGRGSGALVGGGGGGSGRLIGGRTSLRKGRYGKRDGQKQSYLYAILHCEFPPNGGALGLHSNTPKRA